eukprot:6916253-Heterocapsa_arctica.AAC.1
MTSGAPSEGAASPTAKGGRGAETGRNRVGTWLSEKESRVPPPSSTTVSQDSGAGPGVRSGTGPVPYPNREPMRSTPGVKTEGSNWPVREA